ncbi:dihydrolipoyllysine-residue acetyltransferase [Chromatium okenii]|uniref:dihydrolipoyllysine-residue acetyltransferase n=1 Tax=Chromatium okenii TaxID=61644 RepID=UPI001908C2C0|nr:dihydrolipoyllysine-residue acetyltransferase [Chromatium okenii]
MATIEDILLPDIGDFVDVEVIEILVSPGTQIQAEQSVLTLESDKATIEIPAPAAGTVQDIIVKVGDRISQGARLMTVVVENATAAAVTAPAIAPPVAPPPAALVPAPVLATSPAAAARADTVAVVLPDLGDFTDVPVVEILIAPGDRIAVDQSLLTLESDKATMEIPAPQSGVVAQVLVNIGDVLNPGDLILTLLAEPAPVEPVAAAAPAPAEAATRAHGEAERRPAPVLPRPDDMTAIAVGRKPHASPTVRRLARELGVDLARVKGSGPKGRATKVDVQAFVKQALTQGSASTPAVAAASPFALPSAPEVDYSRFGAIEVVPLARIKKLSGRHLHRSWLTVPHVTQFDEADITELEAFRKAQANQKDGVKLTLLPFLLKAVAVALKQMPILQASLSSDGESLIYKHFTHIGVAVDTPNGLLVPVVRDVTQKSLTTLATELAELSARARDGKLLPADLQGGCFSISSLGGIGGTAFTPIVNAPEVAILGVSRAAMKPVWNGSDFVPRLLLPLSLSYDHRVVDGADGVRFTTLLAQLLGDIRRLLL